jgi:hypothetical protein
VNFPEKTADSVERGAKSGAVAAATPWEQLPLAVRQAIELAWPTLPEHIRAEIRTLIGQQEELTR